MKENSASIFVSEGSSIFYIRPDTVGSETVTELPLSLNTAVITGVSYDIKSKQLFIADMNSPAIYSINMTSLHMRWVPSFLYPYVFFIIVNSKYYVYLNILTELLHSYAVKTTGKISAEKIHKFNEISFTQSINTRWTADLQTFFIVFFNDMFRWGNGLPQKWKKSGGVVSIKIIICRH